MNKIYNIITNSASSGITAEMVQNALTNIKTSFTRIRDYITNLTNNDTTINGTAQFNENAYLLYSLFCENIL